MHVCYVVQFVFLLQGEDYGLSFACRNLHLIVTLDLGKMTNLLGSKVPAKTMAKAGVSHLDIGLAR